MTGETPDDIEARRVANEKVLRDAISSAFTKPIPSVVPRDPTPRMSENNGGYANGQYRELKADVDNLKVNFSDLRHDIDARFKEQSADSREMHREMLERLDKQTDQQNSGKPSIEKVATVGFGAISLVLTLVWGYSTLTQGAINDKIAFTNSKIDTDISRTEKTIDRLAEGVIKRADHVDERFQKLVDDTVPRRELDKSFAALQTGVDSSVNKDVFNETKHFRDDQIASLRMDIERIKGDVVSRREHEQHWADSNERFTNMTNRLNEVAKSSAGTPAIDAIRQLQDRVDALTNKFVAVPK